jgi:hypothetical protein
MIMWTAGKCFGNASTVVLHDKRSTREHYHVIDTFDKSRDDFHWSEYNEVMVPSWDCSVKY